jgi:hypothetical protein
MLRTIAAIVLKVAEPHEPLKDPDELLYCRPELAARDIPAPLRCATKAALLLKIAR